jgi:transcriptional regulator with XRE-family HTH domain
MPTTPFGTLLQRLREQAGLSQSGLATRADVPFRTIQNWEQGHREPRPGALITLARALGVEPGVLLAAFDSEAAAVDKAAPKRSRTGGDGERKRPRRKAEGE